MKARGQAHARSLTGEVGAGLQLCTSPAPPAYGPMTLPDTLCSCAVHVVRVTEEMKFLLYGNISSHRQPMATARTSRRDISILVDRSVAHGATL